MSTSSSSTKRARFVCVVCAQKKPPTFFPTLSADICNACTAEIAAETPAKAPTPPAPTPPETLAEPQNASSGDVFVSQKVEGNPLNPTLAELAARTLARRRLLPFIKRFRPKYNAGWVHEDVCRRLEQFVKDVENKLEPRLLLMMPVRSGKSEIASRHFAPWVLGPHPDWEIIAASGAQSLAMSFSRYIRDLVRDPSYQSMYPNTRLDPASQSVENWNTTSGGGYLAAGIGTMITGRGAHILIVDDPVKDAEAADSRVIRDATWEWYMSTAHTRLAPGGGVLGIMCMTGDTPVLMASGVEKRLDTLAAGDEIGTYANGRLSVSNVVAVKSNGRDSVLKITTTSGKIVRANGRHPFLVVLGGELKWVRARNLNTGHRIVALRGSGGSGRESLAQQITAQNRLSAEGSVLATTSSRNGPTGGALSAMGTTPVATPDSSTATALPLLSTTPCTLVRAAAALYASALRKLAVLLGIGKASSPSTTATTPAESVDCSATTATQELDTLELSQWHLPHQSTYDFTLGEIASVEADGVEEVFDVQVADTENFIANGLVSHNTWWHDDDWAGRIQQVMSTGDGDKFEIVKYPAINDQGDEYILADDTITQIPPGSDVPSGARMTRPHNSALHPERYTLESLLRRKANYYALGQQRWWAALYQQNPTPEEGAYFTKDMFQYYGTAPRRMDCNVFQAWDFAITEKQQSDWTVGVTIMQDINDNISVVDVRRFRLSDGHELISTVVGYAKEWEPSLIGFEDGQIWKALASTFTKTCNDHGFYPAFEVLTPLTDKMVRAQPLRGRMQAKKIWFDRTAPWYSALQQEFLRFPTGTHDDQVDALAWAVRLTLSKSAPKPPAPPRIKSWRDRLDTLLVDNNTHMAA